MFEGDVGPMTGLLLKACNGTGSYGPGNIIRVSIQHDARFMQSEPKAKSPDTPPRILSSSLLLLWQSTN